MNKDMKDMAAKLSAQGWTLERGRKHAQAKGPGGALVTLPLTPSDRRSVLNTRALLRRAGAEL